MDDNRSIHEDIRKILLEGTGGSTLDAMEAELFGDNPPAKSTTEFQMNSAYQGEQALDMVQASLREGRPYTVAFVDMRMPPGWDGIETIEHVWMADPDLQIVICSAYSDHSWSEIVERLGVSDQLLILKKPFDNIEIVQMAHALSRKWVLQWQAKRESEAIYQAIYDDNPAMFFTLDTQRRGTVGQQVWGAAAGLRRR